MKQWVLKMVVLWDLKQEQKGVHFHQEKNVCEYWVFVACDVMGFKKGGIMRLTRDMVLREEEDMQE